MMNSTYLAELVSLQKNPLRILVLTVLFLSFHSRMFAQEAVELDVFLNEQGSGNTEIVKGFVFENVPALTWRQGAIAGQVAQNTQKLVTDVASVKQVISDNTQHRYVKFLQINIENAGEKGQVRLNPELLGSFTNLQYVFIQSQVSLTAAEVSAMVSGYEEGDVVLLYQVVSNF
jgi:hypothetical protein